MSAKRGVPQPSHLPPRILDPDEWRNGAACRNVDPEIFYPDAGGQGVKQQKARAVCRRCPVREQCGEYAITHKEAYGIWGGMTESERRLISKGPRW